jgi:cell division transport system permease protein
MVLTVSLGSVAFIATLSTTIGFGLRQLNDQLVITAYLNRDITPETIERIQEDFESLDGVRSVTYADRETAKQELTANNAVTEGIARTLEDENANLILEYLEIVPTDVNSYDRVIERVNSSDYEDAFNSIIDIQEIRNRLEQIYFMTNIAGIILVTIFAFVSILVMVNILRIAIYNHKDEIEIMRLVGATNSYIRGPFIAEGVYFNIIAALIILAVFIPGVTILLPNLEEFMKVSLDTSTQNLVYQMYFSVAGTILLGGFAGVVTTYLATQRYLKL